MMGRFISAVRRYLVRSHLEKARSAQQEKRWADAHEAYGVALRTDRRFSTLVQMGHMSKEMSDFTQAEAYYTEALRMLPQDWDLHVQFGHLFNRAGDLEKARIWYLKADKIRSTAEIKELLSTIYNQPAVEGTRELRARSLHDLDAGRFESALPVALALYNIHGLKDFDVILGHGYRETGRLVDAKEMYLLYFQRCLTSGSDQLLDSVINLVRVLKLLGEDKEILKVFKELKESYYSRGCFEDFNANFYILFSENVTANYSVFAK